MRSSRASALAPSAGRARTPPARRAERPCRSGPGSVRNAGRRRPARARRTIRRRRAPSDGSAVEPAAASSELRLVSVLFADLVGFTSASEVRDPEETRAFLDAYFALARSVIERHGGTVEKFIGDAVMAVWGAPVAREDDAEQAVRAALELVDAASQLPGPDGPPLLRAGVLTGEAAVTLGSTARRWSPATW